MNIFGIELHDPLGTLIDRIFRTVEMIGVTALLGTVTAAQHPSGSKTLVYIGTIMVTLYWLSGINFTVMKIIGSRYSDGILPVKWFLLSTFLVGSSCATLSIYSIHFVLELSADIGRTITVAPSK